MNLFAIGTKVTSVSDEEYPNPITGTVVGHTVQTIEPNEPQLLYLIKLDEPIRDEKRRNVVSVILADHSSLYARGTVTEETVYPKYWWQDETVRRTGGRT